MCCIRFPQLGHSAHSGARSNFDVRKSWIACLSWPRSFCREDFENESDDTEPEKYEVVIGFTTKGSVTGVKVSGARQGAPEGLSRGPRSCFSGFFSGGKMPFSAVSGRNLRLGGDLP